MTKDGVFEFNNANPKGGMRKFEFEWGEGNTFFARKTCGKTKTKTKTNQWMTTDCVAYIHEVGTGYLLLLFERSSWNRASLFKKPNTAPAARRRPRSRPANAPLDCRCTSRGSGGLPFLGGGRPFTCNINDIRRVASCVIAAGLLSLSSGEKVFQDVSEHEESNGGMCCTGVRECKVRGGKAMGMTGFSEMPRFFSKYILVMQASRGPLRGRRRGRAGGRV
ncbi:hypothetical protein B0H19DRAFT_589101 [Mycena capillaripes]|nr:hypothetical protein B0H19DRAFT_589101 [Mycena capillaripes]